MISSDDGNSLISATLTWVGARPEDTVGVDEVGDADEDAAIVDQLAGVDGC